MFPQSRRRFLAATGAAAGLFPAAAASKPDGYPDVKALREARAAKGIVPPNKTYRMMEWECHTPPEGNFDIDLEAALAAARDAGAESMMFYSQDHWGYAFYPSKVAVTHPKLKGDFFGQEVAIARRLGMSVVCYYSLQFNNQAVLSHPDWGWVNEKNEPERMRWYITCLDSPYRQYVLGMLDELFAKYEIDELFLDIFGIQFHAFHSSNRNPFCFCPQTIEAWNQAHPGDDYREGFATKEGWEKRYQWHQKRSMTDILDEIIATIRKHRPNVLISLNGGPESFPDDIMQKVSFIYAEPLTSTTGISLGSILMRGWSRPDYQAGVFSQQGYLDTYPGALPRVKADALVVQNARVFIVGNAPVVGGLDGKGFSKRWFQVAKETWADVRNIDHLLEGVQPFTSAAALYSQPTREFFAGERTPQDFRRSVLGALETMTYSGRPVESIPEFRLTRDLLKQFDTFVLPEVEVLSDAHADLIREWVAGGGTLVATGRCGLLDERRKPRKNFPLADVFGVDMIREERKYAYDQQGKLKRNIIQTYLESAGHPYAASLEESTVGLPGAFLELEPRKGAEPVMRYRLPLMIEDMANNKWFNWGPPPPGTQTGGIAAVTNKFGSGRSVYLGVPMFREVSDRLFWMKRWVPELMRTLVPAPALELRFSELPEYVHGTFFWDKSKRFLLVQILNAVEMATNAQFVDIASADIYVNPARLRVAGAKVVWPHESKLEVGKTGNRLHIRVPKPGRYTALYLKVA